MPTPKMAIAAMAAPLLNEATNFIPNPLSVSVEVKKCFITSEKLILFRRKFNQRFKMPLIRW